MPQRTIQTNGATLNVIGTGSSEPDLLFLQLGRLVPFVAAGDRLGQPIALHRDQSAWMGSLGCHQWMLRSRFCNVVDLLFISKLSVQTRSD